MQQRRKNNRTTISDRGIKCLERMSCVHTSGIGAFYTSGDIFRRTFDRPSGIRWCWYPVETINENRRRVLTKLFDGFCLMPVGDVRTSGSTSLNRLGKAKFLHTSFHTEERIYIRSLVVVWAFTGICIANKPTNAIAKKHFFIVPYSLVVKIGIHILFINEARENLLAYCHLILPYLHSFFPIVVAISLN